MSRDQYIITITVDALEETDLRKATELACDRMTSYDPSILILDSDVDYDTPETPPTAA
jgi:hypothetical protein